MKIVNKLIASSLGMAALASLFLVAPTNASATTFKPESYVITRSVVKAKVGHDRYTIPKGTRVHITSDGSLDVSRLSYNVIKTHKESGDPFKPENDAMHLSGSQFVKTQRKFTDSIPFTLSQGYRYTTGAAALNAKAFQITTDGYVETFKHEATNVKPQSMVKITASRASGNTMYIYTKSKMVGLHAKHIASKTGKYNYRLAVINNKKVIKSTDLGTVMRSHSFSIGIKSNYYYYTNTWYD